MPYYFLGRDPATGAYLPDSILVCIDVLHVDYRVPDGSEYFDLATLVPEETAVRISRTLNAGLQLAAQRGLTIVTDGRNRPQRESRTTHQPDCKRLYRSLHSSSRTRNVCKHHCSW